VLIQVFNLAERDDIIRKNPCVMAYRDVCKECYKEPREKRISLTAQEQKAFLGYVEGHPVYNRWYPFAVAKRETLVDCGFS